jgi:hypothetical protein
MAAIKLGCSYVGFEIDREQVDASNARLRKVWSDDAPLFDLAGVEHGCLD